MKERVRNDSQTIERLFIDDIREKKRTGSGAFHMRGKGVKHGISGALRTPSYFMKTKEKKQLNSEVRCYNMYSTILTIDEFQRKDQETQKNMLSKWREVHTNKEIAEKMGIPESKIYPIIKELGIGKNYNVGAKKERLKTERKNGEQMVAPLPNAATPAAAAQPAPPITNNVQIPTRLITNGLHLEYSGEYDAEQINKMLTKLQLILEGEESKYIVNFTISEQV